MNEQAERQKKTKHAIRYAAVIVGTVVVICLASLLLFEIWLSHNYFIVKVMGDSMQNTLYDSDMVYASYARSFDRGSVVIINVKPYQDRDGFENEEYIVKRIIAKEGDTIRCKTGEISVKYAGTDSFVVLYEPYASGVCRRDFERELTVKEIFFLGDNRAISKDSSSPQVGIYHESDIVGVIPDWVLANRKITNDWVQFTLIFGKNEITF